MVKDIFSMTKEEFIEKMRLLHENIKEENARYGLPTTGYSETYRCVVDTYKDGRIEKVDINKTKPKVAKYQNYPTF